MPAHPVEGQSGVTLLVMSKVRGRVCAAGWVTIGVLCLPPAVGAQPKISVPVPRAERTADPNVFDTQQLVNAAHQLTTSDLPRLQASAEMGEARAQILLGLAYEMGAAGLMPQSVEALSWFLKAAEQGIVWAQVWAADFYFTGSPGVDRDFKKALALYTSAAERGDAKGAFFAGQMYFYGDGLMADHREAARWFRRALEVNPEVVQPMIELAEAPCSSAFCVALRQVMAAVMNGSVNRFIDGWDDGRREWDTNLKLPDTDRCGLTSADRTSAGEVQNYFCDSGVIADEERGVAMARQLADDVQKSLPAGFTRNERSDARPGPTTYFAREGFAHIRVSFNVTPGSAQHRVTLVVGP